MSPQKNEYSLKYSKSNSKKGNKNFKKGDKVLEIISKIESVSKLSEIKPKDYADVGGYADVIAKNFSKTLNTNQLRKFFGAVRDIERNNTWDKIEPELYLLKPKFAVSVGRKLIPKDFFKVMEVCMNKIDVGKTANEKEENFDTFVKFFEAIVAYHKYYSK